MDNQKKFVDNVGSLADKKHPILPNKISVQLKNKNGENLKIENVLCHLNIYFDTLGYYTYSFIPTNSNGIVNLTKEDIIQNTLLKHCYDENLPLDKTPVKFEFFVMETTILDQLISSLENYFTLDFKSYESDLKRRGLTDEHIALHIKVINEKRKSDMELYDFLKKNKNADVINSTEELKLTGFWNGDSDCSYELINN